MAARKPNINKRRVSNTRILILCEGKTEKFYLQGLRKTLPRKAQRNIDLDIISAKESEPVKAVKEIKTRTAKAKKEMQPYTETWLVFDHDNRNLQTLFQQLERENIKHVFSSAAIEFWFLLHLEDTARSFANAAELIRHLTITMDSYSKTDADIWTKLAAHYNTAKTRAQRIRNNHEAENTVIHLRKPYTNMDVLVDRIKELANE